VIPWWGWLVLWTSLVLVLLVVLALSGWLLFRKFIGVLDELGELTEKSAIFDRVESELPLRARSAILEPIALVRERRAFQSNLAAERRAARHGKRIARARRIVAVDPATIHLIELPRR
jgi:hypothetical protein